VHNFCKSPKTPITTSQELYPSEYRAAESLAHVEVSVVASLWLSLAARGCLVPHLAACGCLWQAASLADPGLIWLAGWLSGWLRWLGWLGWLAWLGWSLGVKPCKINENIKSIKAYKKVEKTYRRSIETHWFYKENDRIKDLAES
jgi:hypothetical protein